METVLQLISFLLGGTVAFVVLVRGARIAIERAILLPERVERVLPERHEIITFYMIWRSVSAAAAA